MIRRLGDFTAGSTVASNACCELHDMILSPYKACADNKAAYEFYQSCRGQTFSPAMAGNKRDHSSSSSPNEEQSPPNKRSRQSPRQIVKAGTNAQNMPTIC